MKEKCKVVILPSKKESYIYKGRNNLFLNIRETVAEATNVIPQHLYILSDDEIKKGDWYYDGEHKDIRTFGFKIIATTDSSLLRENYKIHSIGFQSIPSPSQSFIEVFVREYNKGNIITEVMVEYECELVKHRISCEECGYPPSEARYDLGSIETELKHILVPKVNPKDNTITIHKIKDSWNRKEIEGLLVQFNRTYNAGYDIPRWLDQNLKY